ncbi:MAG: UDP-N-acetylmuramate dehydrogenase [Candidatus Liptonbacteria bacterium]|nr:UDP-N-acetylmuramate dehydrogenase [Candidatus Liptonbacteria bacterium]
MFQENISLSRFSNYKIGGNAKYFYEAKTEAELVKAIEKWDSRGRIFILGGGTNILFDDMGFDGLVLKPNLSYIKKENPPTTTFQHSAECWNVVVGAGVAISKLLDYSIAHGLSGLEWAGGLPGTLGGAIRGNAGCFKGEIKDVIQSVSALKIPTPGLRKSSGLTKSKHWTPQLKTFSNEECKFSYRHSIFKENLDWIILEATLKLQPGDKKEIARLIQEKIGYRKIRHPMEYPNIGSIFKNIPAEFVSRRVIKSFNNKIKTDPFPIVPVVHLISEAGLRGVSHGGAMISPKHPNFIVNAQSASAYDVKSLIALAKDRVFKKFKIKLEEEVMII